MNAIDRSMLALHAVHGGITSNRTAPTEHEKLVRNTQKWVAQTFYGTMLKEMRKSPFHSDEFEGGRGGQAFEEMFDQRLADHMSTSAGAPLVNSIVHRIEAKRHQGSARQILDANSAYARAMQHEKPRVGTGEGREPLRSGEIPWSRHDANRRRAEMAPLSRRESKPAAPIARRRQERILPEVYHVAPTN